MSKRAEREAFKDFKQRHSKRRGYQHYRKPTFPCDPQEACDWVQPDMLAIQPRTGRTVVGDNKDKKRLSMDDVLKLKDDMTRVRRHLQVPKVKGELYIESRTRVSQRVLTAARRRGIDVLEPAP